MARPWRLIQAALSVAFAGMVAAPWVAAQQRAAGYRLGPDGEPVAPAMGGSAPSAFALFSGADRAVSALFTIGYFDRTCLDNIALADIDASGCGPFFQLLPSSPFQAVWFRAFNLVGGGVARGLDPRQGRGAVPRQRAWRRLDGVELAPDRPR